MKLYLLHCGYYDTEISDGVFENHVDFFVAAQSQREARESVRMNPDFLRKRMHVDGIREITEVQNFEVRLIAKGEASHVTQSQHSPHQVLP
jgi:hypothetical protein